MSGKGKSNKKNTLGIADIKQIKKIIQAETLTREALAALRLTDTVTGRKKLEQALSELEKI